MGTSTQLDCYSCTAGGSQRTHGKHYQILLFAPYVLMMHASQYMYYNFINITPILTILLHVHKK